MKRILTIIFFLPPVFCTAQVELKPADLNNLVAISELYSKNPNARGNQFARSIDSLRTPVLNHIADVLIAVGKGDKSILESRFLARPANDELVLWYVIREIHYNLLNKTQSARPDIDVAVEILSKKIDTRWLVDNYYYRIHGGLATLFNDADLSQYNINTDSLGFKDQTENAIFFLNLMDALAGGRFKVLETLKNNKRLLEFSDKLPMFNGKKYYYYKDFDFADFEWIGTKKRNLIVRKT